MLTDPLWKEKLAVAVGLCAEVLGIVTIEGSNGDPQPWIWLGTGIALNIWGLGRYAQVKGYSRLYGLWGVVPIRGAVVIKKLPYRGRQ